LIEQLFDNQSLSDFIEEVAAYFVDSFGNETRIDYGTGK
jgi:hypothetical protein